MIISDAPGATARADINAALQALASTSKNAAAPTTIYAGQHWIEDDTPSSTIWTEKVHDGTDNIPAALIDTANNRVLPAYPLVPGGRLTLTSATPVLNADATAQSTVYYTPFVSDLVPVYSTFWGMFQFSELSLALSSNSGHTGYHQTGKNFDLFVFNDAGTLRLGTGPAWSSDTARGSGAGTTQIGRVNGVWVNAVSMTARFGSASGNTVTVGASQGTYVGTMRCTADGQTGMAFKPSAAAGGGNNVLGLSNAYHRVPVRATSRDSTASWTYATATWRSANNNTANRVSFVDGLQASAVDAHYTVGNDNSGSQSGQIGVNLDSASATPNVAGQGAATLAQSLAVSESFPPQLGFHYVQAVEYATGPTATFRGVNTHQIQALAVGLMM